MESTKGAFEHDSKKGTKQGEKYDVCTEIQITVTGDRSRVLWKAMKQSFASQTVYEYS